MAFPDGWLWTNTNAAARMASARPKTNLGSTTVPVNPPREMHISANTRLERRNNTIQNSSCCKSANLLAKRMCTSRLLLNTVPCRRWLCSRRRPNSIAAATTVALAGPMPSTVVKLSMGQVAKLWRQPCANSYTSWAKSCAFLPLCPVPRSKARSSCSFKAPNPSNAARSRGLMSVVMTQKKPSASAEGFSIRQRALEILRGLPRAWTSWISSLLLCSCE